MKLPTPLVAIVGGGLGIAAAVLGFQAVTAVSPTAAGVSQVADLNATSSPSPSATEEPPSVEETPSAPAPSTPSVKPSPKEERHYSAPTSTQTAPATTWHETESESGSGYSSESGDD